MIRRRSSVPVVGSDRDSPERSVGASWFSPPLKEEEEMKRGHRRPRENQEVCSAVTRERSPTGSSPSPTGDAPGAAEQELDKWE